MPDYTPGAVAQAMGALNQTPRPSSPSLLDRISDLEERSKGHEQALSNLNQRLVQLSQILGVPV